MGARLVGGQSGLLASFGLGAIFSIGWTPCIGVILGGILGLAATSSTMLQGAVLLVAYTLGLGIPFLLVGVLYDRAPALIRPLIRHGRVISLIGGLLVVAIGVAMLFDWLKLPAPLVPVRGRLRVPNDPGAAEPAPEIETARPEVRHERARHGVIGPFSGRQLIAAFAAVVVVAIVLIAVTTPLGRIGDTGPGDPRPTAYVLQSPPAEGLRPGDAAPELAFTREDGSAFQLTDLDGKPVRLDALRGRGVWINFWASWCPPCQAETPILREMAARYADRGLTVIGDQRPGDQRRRRPRLRRALRPRLHGRGRPPGRRLPALPRLRPADPVLHRARRDHPRRSSRARSTRRGRPQLVEAILPAAVP